MVQYLESYICLFMFIKLKRVIDLHQEIVTINNVYMPEKNIFTKFENHLSSLLYKIYKLYKIEFICTYFGYFGVISKLLCCDICSVKKISLIYFIQSHCLVTGKVRSSIQGQHTIITGRVNDH